MNRYLLLLLFLSGMAISAKSQTTTDDKFSIKFSGFVKAEAMFDSRQVVSYREQMLLLYPDKKKLDKDGNDVNAHPSLNQLAMASRITLTATGPDAFGAKIKGVIEGDFTGPSNVENNAFRLRHAYVKLSWPKSELLMGQYWHPLNVPEMIPYVISLNTGAPFHPFSRQPQIRFTRTFGKMSAVLVASSNRDYTSLGPATGSASEYLRNSAIPSMDLQLQYKKGENIFFGIGGDYKRLTPRLMTDSVIEANESLDCIAATAFLKVKTKKVTVKLQSVFGQNLYEHMMMGGYAVESIDTTQRQTYTNLDQFTIWTDISTTLDKKFNAGIFCGYAKNLGSQHNIWTNKYYGRGTDIAYAYRIAPRLMWTFNNLTFASEFEYTVASYGTPDYLGDVQNAIEIGNFRLELAIQYIF